MKRIYIYIHTYGQLSVTTGPSLYVFELWEETAANPHSHEENM